MRIVHIPDLHVTEGPRLSDHARTLQAIVTRIVDDVRPDVVLLTGDFYGHTVPHRSTPAERAVLYPELERLAGVAPVVVVAGNHDHPVDVAGMRHVRGRFPIHVALRPEVVDVAALGGPPISVYCLPYPTARVLLGDREARAGLRATWDAVQARLSELFAEWRAAIAAARAANPARAHVLAGHVSVRGSCTSGGEVLAGREIEVGADELQSCAFDAGCLGHIHLRQEVAQRVWYGGSAWRNDFSEVEWAKGWQVIALGASAEDRSAPPFAFDEALWCSGDDTQLPAWFGFVASPARRLVTLDYRWGVADAPAGGADADAPRWLARPSDEEIAGVGDGGPGVPGGAEVRMRLLVPAQWSASCPWDEEVARVTAAGAVRVVVERQIQASQRVRAPEVAEAATLADQLEAYWRTLSPPPAEADRARALDRLPELESAVVEGAPANP